MVEPQLDSGDQSPPKSKITLKSILLALAIVQLSICLIYPTPEVFADAIASFTVGGFVVGFMSLCGYKANAFLTRHNEPILFPAMEGKNPHVLLKCFVLFLLSSATIVAAVVVPESRAVIIGMGVYGMMSIVIVGLARGVQVYSIVARKRKQEEERLNAEEEGTLLVQDKGGRRYS